MKQQIYKSWQGHLNQRIFIEELFSKNSKEEDIYNAVLKSMRYISKNIHFSNGEFKQELKQDLKKVRDWYLG